MQKVTTVIVGVSLVVASASQMATATEPQKVGAYRTPAVAGERFRDANASLAWSSRSFCSQHAGNPYDERTDYLAWSAFRQSGAWDSRNDCP